MLQPLVSVVMCTYNGSQFLDEQIKSILNQEYRNLELIIVDDASTDDTWQKLEKWQQQDKRIRIYRNEINVGYNKNFIYAIKLAKGDLIAISDQDDIWMPTKISKQVVALKNNNTVLSHNRSVRFENGRLRFKSASLFHHFKGNDTRGLFMFNQINGHDIMFKKELVNKFIPVPEGMMYDWWIAVIATCYGKIASVDEYLVHHRIHRQNSFFNTAKSQKEQLDLQDVLKLFSTIDVLTTESKKFLNNFLHLLTEHNKLAEGTFDFNFFRFLYKNGRVLFGHKKRLVPQFNYLKNALKFARFNFEGKGITF